MKHFFESDEFSIVFSQWVNGKPMRKVEEETGISASTICRIMNGHSPSLEVFGSLCKLMEIDPAHFFYPVKIYSSHFITEKEMDA